MHMAPHKAQERAAVLKPAKCCCCLADEQLLQSDLDKGAAPLQRGWPQQHGLQ